MITTCTPVTADGTVYSADNGTITADIIEFCVTVASGLLDYPISFMQQQVRKRKKRGRLLLLLG